MRIFIDMLRTLLFAVVFMSGMAAKAQTDTSFSVMNGMEPAFRHPLDTNYIQKKWFVTKYTGISTGFVAFKGGSGSFLSVPLALQVNRQLTNNFYAFGQVSATPYVFRYNGMPYQPAISKNNGFMQTQRNNFAAYSDAKIGVMYISNDKTFSISGSIGVSRGGSYYNGYSPFYAPVYAPMGGNMQR